MPPPKDPKKYEEWLQKQRASHLGKTTWMKGKKHNQEAIEKVRLAKLGNSFRKGKVNSPEHRLKNRLAQLGKPSPFKGKTHTPEAIEKNRLSHIGKTHTEEWKRNKSLSYMGEKNPFYNKTHSDETKLAISKANTGKVPWIANKKHTEETRAKLRITRLAQVFPRKDSKPEKILQIALTLQNIKFEKHAKILGQPDIFIHPNLCVFVDGDAVHGNPKLFRYDDMIAFNVVAKDRWIKDQLVTMKLLQDGYYVLRIWENDILNDANQCVDFINDFINKFLQ